MQRLIFPQYMQTFSKIPGNLWLLSFVSWGPLLTTCTPYTPFSWALVLWNPFHTQQEIYH